MSYMECPCGIHRDDCVYHKLQQQKKPYGCRYPDCMNNSSYFALSNNAEYGHICKEHYKALQDMFKKHYILPVDLF